MIKLALKHFIYDKCLEVFFENIIQNFSSIDTLISSMKVGNRYRRIKINTPDHTKLTHMYLYECKIEGFIRNLDGWDKVEISFRTIRHCYDEWVEKYDVGIYASAKYYIPYVDELEP